MHDTANQTHPAEDPAAATQSQSVREDITRQQRGAAIMNMAENVRAYHHAIRIGASSPPCRREIRLRPR